MSCGLTPAYLGSARGLCGDDDVTHPVSLRGELGGASGGSGGALSRRTQKVAPSGSGRAGLCLMEGAARAEAEAHEGATGCP